MKRNQKKWISMALTASMLLMSSCSYFEGKGKPLPKANGTRKEQIEYHKKEIEKYRAKIEQEERTSQRALSRQDMNDARSAQNRKMQYQKKIDQHTVEMHNLRGNDGL